MKTFTSAQVLAYIKKIHKKGFKLDSVIASVPQWELKKIDLDSLELNEFGEKTDPYNRVLNIDFDYVDDLTDHDIATRPIVADSQGYIIDGNHRATKALELGMSTIPAFVPVLQLEEGVSPGEYVYHAGHMPRGLDSVLRRGLLPSKDGYAGPGVYFAYDPEGGYYHVSQEEATMFRVKWSDLINKFGAYPENKNGVERDDEQIIVPGAVPASMLEVEYFPGEWWDIASAVAADRGPERSTDFVSEYRAAGKASVAGTIKLGNQFKDTYQVVNTPISHLYEVRIDDSPRESYPSYYFYNKDTGACVGSFSINAMPDEADEAAAAVNPGVSIVQPHMSLAQEVQGKGLGSLIYRTFLAGGNWVFATYRHTTGAGALWDKLAGGDIISVLYDPETNQFVKQGSKESRGYWSGAIRLLGPKERFKNKQGVAEGGSNEGIVNEGGWASAATQNTVITPHVIEEAINVLDHFEREFNAWQAKNELDVEMRMGKPVGSGTYYKRDLTADPTREYGDVDVVCYIHSREGVGAARRTSEYADAVKSFADSHTEYNTSNGTNVIMDTSAGPIQVDLIFTYNEHADWARALAPEYRVKGVISTSLMSSVAEVLNMSFGIQGVQVKTREGRPVSFRQSKDTQLSTVSIDPHNWGGDMYSYYYQLAHGTKPAVPGNLAQHGGLKDEQRLSDIVKTIHALANDFETAGLFGTGALDYIANSQDFMQKISRVYAEKLDKVINSNKFDKAATPGAVEKANKTRVMLAKYRNEIAKLLVN